LTVTAVGVLVVGVPAVGVLADGSGAAVELLAGDVAGGVVRGLELPHPASSHNASASATRIVDPARRSVTGPNARDLSAATLTPSAMGFCPLSRPACLP
jgi:hypothetical protein